MIVYLDTSAAMKLLVEEDESPALHTFLTQSTEPGDLRLVASWLLHTELHCAAQRSPQYVDAAAAEELLDRVELIDVTRADLVTAGALWGRLRSHDAIHLAVAMRVPAEAMATYDAELVAALDRAGLQLVQPS